MNDDQRDLSRRNLVKGVAWTVPAVAAVAAVPAYAASTPPTPPPTLPPPASVTVVKNGSCHSGVSWTPVTGATSYQLRYHLAASGNDQWSLPVSTTSTTYTFTTPADIRRVQVRANASSPWATGTWPQTTLLPPPTNVTAVRNGNTYTVSWTPPADAFAEAASYTVQGSQPGTGGTFRTVETRALTGTSATFSSDATYDRVRVRMTACGTFTTSKVAHITTA